METKLMVDMTTPVTLYRIQGNALVFQNKATGITFKVFPDVADVLRKWQKAVSTGCIHVRGEMWLGDAASGVIQIKAQSLEPYLAKD